MSGFHNCRGCFTEVRCAELGRCLDVSSAQAPVENRGASQLVGCDDLLGELTPVVWKGRRYFRIPGPDCDACGGTGWSVVHGLPRGRDGLPHMNGYCFACHRDPQKFITDRLSAMLAAKSSPNE